MDLKVGDFPTLYKLKAIFLSRPGSTRLITRSVVLLEVVVVVYETASTTTTTSIARGCCCYAQTEAEVNWKVSQPVIYTLCAQITAQTTPLYTL